LFIVAEFPYLLWKEGDSTTMHLSAVSAEFRNSEVYTHVIGKDVSAMVSPVDLI